MADLDCRTCGACCAGTGEAPFALPITRAEARQLPRDVLGGDPHIPSLPQHRRSLRAAPDANRCAALKGAIGESCSCRVYANRPEVCRVFPAGSPHCLAARAALGVP